MNIGTKTTTRMCMGQPNINQLKTGGGRVGHAHEGEAEATLGCGEVLGVAFGGLERHIDVRVRRVHVFSSTGDRRGHGSSLRNRLSVALRRLPMALHGGLLLLLLELLRHWLLGAAGRVRAYGFKLFKLDATSSQILCGEFG